MWETVVELPTPFVQGGTTWRVSIQGMARADGTWAGRIVFTGPAESRQTSQETSQPNREAVEYWATGLEKVFLEGAFARAR